MGRDAAMAAGKFVAYYRVSTDKQGRSGLGIDAQHKAVADFLNGGNWELIAEYTEIESGKLKDRPELKAAIAAARRQKARLVIAKLDRLARNAAFLLTLRDSGVDFVAADMPQADKLTIGVMAIFAEHERDMIAKRTREALAAAKRRGVKLGSPCPDRGSAIGAAVARRQADQRASNVAPIIRDIQRAGIASMAGIAEALNNRGIASPRGRAWGPSQVWRVLQRPQGSQRQEPRACLSSPHPWQSGSHDRQL
jgi:DNA invertase Pin-like site-specific DNA recombinase